MSVLPIFRNPALAGTAARFTRAVARTAGLLAVSALIAVPPAHASVHHAVAPVGREARGLVTTSRHAPVEHHKAGDSRPARGAVPARETAHIRGQNGSRRAGSRVAEDEPLHHSLSHGKGRHAAQDDVFSRQNTSRREEMHGRKTTREMARRESSGARDKRSLADADLPVHGARGRSNAAVAARHIPLEDDAAADRGTQDRVHAWYRQHGDQPKESENHERRDVASNSVPVARTAMKAGPSPDLTTAPHKATTADFTRAAAAQRETIQSAAEQNSRQTTAADDAADAETRIPSTAPTEREPLPFTHGEMPHEDSTPASSVSGSSSRRAPAPTVRQHGDVLAANVPAATVDLHPPVTLVTPAVVGPAHVELRPAKPSSVLHPPTPAAPDAAVLAANPTSLSAESSPRTVRAVVAETVASPTPRLQLPAPATVAGRKPAIAAVQASNRHPVLDPAVSAGMAEETFDGDNTPATAGTAIRLSTGDTRPHATSPADDATTIATVKVNLYDGNGQLLLLPPMKGTHEILVHQNQMAVADGLERIQNDSQLAEMRRARLLVDLPDDDSIYPNDALPLNRRYARPWTVRFLRDIARAHYARFGTPLIVTSAARTVDFQRRLVRVNGNAAPPTGDIASPHLYGQAVDLAKRGMSLTEITWMRAYLTPVEDEGKIDVEEEFQQACFHISVYRRYLGVTQPQKPAQQLGRPTLLQAKTTPETTPAPRATRHLPTALLATHLP